MVDGVLDAGTLASSPDGASSSEAATRTGLVELVNGYDGALELISEVGWLELSATDFAYEAARAWPSGCLGRCGPPLIGAAR